MTMSMNDSDESEELKERVVHINRVAKVVKGGRRFSFSALVVVGDGQRPGGRRPGQGQRGPRGDPQGQRPGAQEPVPVPLVGGTIPHEVLGHFGAGEVLLRPASPGTGVIAGGAVRAVVESAGIRTS
jgi:small subunit ribosomal protein S5